MPIEVKLMTVGIIVLLVALIAAYHLWLDRRARRPAATAAPAPAGRHTVAPPPGNAASRKPATAAGTRRSSLRRVR